MPNFAGIPVQLSSEVPDPGYEYVPGIGIRCRPEKLDEVAKKLNAANMPGEVSATDEQIREVIRGNLDGQPN